MIFVIDEDLPRSTAKILRAKGFEVYDIRDHGFRGQADEEILSFATLKKAILITGRRNSTLRSSASPSYQRQIVFFACLFMSPLRMNLRPLAVN
ncbi:MAG: DUF5615 family PIN-like protein [Solirubrobacteraceae bacterium]|nr:DUF5615 family PIN-like protein [Solirubrobacteraceae bacterium]